jgi:hypothetical protein
LRLLESADGATVSLRAVLNLHIAQYSARIFELRHRFGYSIENGCDDGRPDRTWFRLAGRNILPPPRTAHIEAGEQLAIRQMQRAVEIDDYLEQRRLFSEPEPKKWRDPEEAF